MCIRDSHMRDALSLDSIQNAFRICVWNNDTRAGDNRIKSCLLYTSDAADERSSVDLGGRRIIKKNKLYYIDNPLLPIFTT